MKEFVPNGHFYSPIVNINDVRKAESRIWTDKPHVIGIDFNDPSHEKILTREFPKYIHEYDYPSEMQSCGKPFDFYNNNPNFSWLDSRALTVMLRMLNPENMIEIGSGYSSLLTADVNRRFLNNRLNLTCIEPYPEQFLLNGVPGISELIKSEVQDLPLSTFDNLKSGDILFIDSSHVSKTGSDVNHIYFEIIPRLTPSPVFYDYVENFHLAEVQQEVTLVDFGTPRARRHMQGGWWGDEGSEDVTFVWGFGEKSVLEFSLSEVREIQVTFRCTPFQFPGSPTQTISIAVNGKEVGQVTLEPATANCTSTSRK